MTHELPNNPEAEELLLSSIFVAGAEGMAHAINVYLSAESFYVPSNSVIFAAMMAVAGKGQAPDMPSVLHELNYTKQTNEAGGMVNLLRIVRLVPTAAGLAGYLTRVKDLQILRRMIRTMTGLAEEGYFQDASVPEFADRVERTMAGLATDRVKPARTWPQVGVEAEAEMDELLTAKPGQVLPGEVSWGFPDLDRVFGVIGKAQLVIVAARPSVGKSSLMRQTATSLLKTGKGVFVASLEVRDRAIFRNIAQAESGISYKSLRFSPHRRDVDEFRSALHAVKAFPMHVADDFGASVSQICAHARILHGKKPLGMVVVDHLHELAECKNPPRGSNVAQAYGRATKSFKELSGELDIPVMLLAQLNRGSENEKREPSLADLRDSGEIEAGADRVVFLHRPAENPLNQMSQAETSDPSSNPTFYIKVIQAKGRDDGTNSLGLIFERATARFRMLAPDRHNSPPDNVELFDQKKKTKR